MIESITGIAISMFTLAALFKLSNEDLIVCCGWSIVGTTVVPLLAIGWGLLS